MKRSIERVIAEDSGVGKFIAAGCYGRVYEHGPKHVYKEAVLDGTAVWLERCFAIQNLLGISHPLCAMMPEIFSFRKLANNRYVVIMAKYRRVYESWDSRGNGCEQEGALASTCPVYSSKVASIVEAVMGKSPYGDSVANDTHSGNILYCDKRGWIITDPSCSTYEYANRGVQDPKFNRAKRVVTQYGPPRRQ